ncbi:MAG: 5-(carboxyamino)imidazole ribonucleotide synthase [Gammaproteobacteria bacterium]|nr:5-(carboxyamino)imidazole ribonucleotide synthase [Gammaproteobacteria bacterium]
MVIGIIGGGQLARMLALAGYPLGLKFIVLEPAADACAAPVAEQLRGDYDDETLLAELASRCDVVTYEFENVPARAVELLIGKVPVYPPPEALATAQDRLFEKTLCRDLGIATAPFAPVNSLQELQDAMTTIGYPAILKTRREGYDGKGQVVLRNRDDLSKAWKQLRGVAAIVEGFVAFDREISVIAARSVSGELKVYDLAENIHKDGILRLSQARENDPLQAKARQIVGDLMDKLEYVGVIGLELFQCGDELIVNEFAPRVHNSGHWTQNGALTCQFENHLRAILNWPLGATDLKGRAAMVNLIGDMPVSQDVLRHSHAHLHDYGKEPRAGRKLGHINLCASDETLYAEQLQALRKLAGEI